jgi:hypothetical protein
VALDINLYEKRGAMHLNQLLYCRRFDRFAAGKIQPAMLVCEALFVSSQMVSPFAADGIYS